MSESLSPSVIEDLREFDSATVANAIEHFEVRDPTTGYATSELVCQTPEIARPMVGYAITCTIDTTTPGDRRPSGLGELVGLIDAAPKPSVLVAQHVGHERKRCCFFGDMFFNLFGETRLRRDCDRRQRSRSKSHPAAHSLFSCLFDRMGRLTRIRRLYRLEHHGVYLRIDDSAWRPAPWR